MFSGNPNNHKNPGYNVGDTLGWKWKIGEMVNQQMNSSSVIEMLKMINVKAETLSLNAWNYLYLWRIFLSI